MGENRPDCPFSDAPQRGARRRGPFHFSSKITTSEIESCHGALSRFPFSMLNKGGEPGLSGKQQDAFGSGHLAKPSRVVRWGHVSAFVYATKTEPFPPVAEEQMSARPPKLLRWLRGMFQLGSRALPGTLPAATFERGSRPARQKRRTLAVRSGAAPTVGIATFPTDESKI